MTTTSLFHITRLNWLASDEEDAWNRFYDENVMPRVLARRGVLRGARYKIVRGPGYVGWDGPSLANDYLHVFELEDNGAAVHAFMHPDEPSDVGARIPDGRPMLDKLLGVSGLYRPMSGRGTLAMPALLYTTRYEFRPPEDKEKWNRFYDTVIRGRIFSRPGIGAGWRLVLERGPQFHGWLGPEGSSLYFNLYEVLGEEWLDKVMPPVEHLKQWSASEPFGMANINEVRSVYRRIFPGAV